MISRIILDNFRNYNSKEFKFSPDINVIYGNNGVGKTNILEAISLFRKGRGLRSCDLDSMVNNSALNAQFTIYSELDNHSEISNCATSFNKIENKRIFQINNNKSGPIRNFPAIIWLTPKMDSIFNDSKSIRRKFLDKIVADIDPNHLSRINNYEKYLRQRMVLLIEGGDRKWLDIIERQIAELGVAIAIARNDTIEHLNKAILQINSNFIKTEIKAIGQIEECAYSKTSIELEELFLSNLRNGRSLDSQAKRSLFGVHRSDFTANLLEKDNLLANLCSTGEQKSILISITIARVRINSFFGFSKAILLLDEIVSHLDEKNKTELLKELENLEVQSFLTGTNSQIFSYLDNILHKNVKLLQIIN